MASVTASARMTDSSSGTETVTAEDAAAQPAIPPSTDPELTPMMAQYLAVREANPDCLLFYRMGDFYEMFFEDAVAAATALDINLTRRGKIRDRDIPMCGVPVHAAENYLSRLIRKGFRVAICEQTESPADAKKRGHRGPLQRDVVRMVTPGTLVEDNFLPPRENNFLAALAETGRDGLALVATDLSTGMIRAETVQPGQLADQLARLQPAELLISETLVQALAGDGRTDGLEGLEKQQLENLAGCISSRPNSSFDSRKGEAKLCQLYGVTTLDGIADLNRSALAAAAAVLDYLDTTHRGRPIRLQPISIMTDGGALEMDAATRRSLELSRSLAGSRQGSLLHCLDATRSAAGGRLLAARLAAPLTDRTAIHARLDLAEVMIRDTRLAEAMETALAAMPDLERALSRLGLGHGGPRDLAAIADGLRAGGDMAASLARRQTGLLQDSGDATLAMLDALEASLKAGEETARQLTQALGDSLPLQARDGGFIRKDYHPGLEKQRQLRDESRRLIAALQARYAADTGIAALKIKHNNVLGYHIEIRNTHADRLMQNSDFIHRQTTAQAVRFSTTELAELERDMMAAADRALALEMELFQSLVQITRNAATMIAATAEAAARLDVAMATAKQARAYGYCRPLLTDDTRFIIEQGRHPVVERMRQRDAETPFVANTCKLDDKDRLWLLTGPNMAGKSTFLRQNALITIMAQAGFFVPASRAEIGITDRVFCRVGASDDLASGRSTFMVEMVETAAILNQAGPRAFVILDEIGRGTATYDGLSIAWAVAWHLHESNRCRALFATHYHEMTVLEDSLEGLSCHAMKVREWQGEIVFMHEVVKGAADKSYGIHVARLAGVPETVLKRATMVLETLNSRATAGDGIASLPLFDAARRIQTAEMQDPEMQDNDRAEQAAEQETQATTAIMDALEATQPDQLTPFQALELVYRLKTLHEQQTDSRDRTA